MSSASYDLSIGAARADELFASARQRADQPSARQVRQAIVTPEVNWHHVRLTTPG